MIGIVHNGDLKYCPYLKKYEDILIENNIEYEVLFWNRSAIEYNNSNYIPFDKPSELKENKLLKVRDFYCFRKWLLRMIAKKKYDKLIILSTLSGILIQRRLVRHYSCNYIFDIRDYSYEKFYPFYLMEKRIIRHSAFTTISSKGFCKFLPSDYPYVLTHNISECDEKSDRNFIKKDVKMINVVWLGMVRYFEQQTMVMKKLSQDGRFNLWYYGAGAELYKFKQFASENKLKNVHFFGPYDNTDKAILLGKADIINNCYAVDIETKYALSNKFYDGIFYHIPQLVEPTTFKAELTERYNLGIALDPKQDSFADKLYEYYIKIDEENFIRSCENVKRMVLAEEEECLNKIKNFLSSKEEVLGT